MLTAIPYTDGHGAVGVSSRSDFYVCVVRLDKHYPHKWNYIFIIAIAFVSQFQFRWNGLAICNAISCFPCNTIHLPLQIHTFISSVSSLSFSHIFDITFVLFILLHLFTLCIYMQTNSCMLQGTYKKIISLNIFFMIVHRKYRFLQLKTTFYLIYLYLQILHA